MAHRLLVNPDTAQQWEISLPAGMIRVGRREDNDHCIDHPSISGSHCEIVVGETGLQIRDLGSTNGTFINRSPVREGVLMPGQHLQLGSVDLRYEFVGAPMGTAHAVKPSGSLRLAVSPRAPAPVLSPPEPEAETENPIGEPPLPPPLMASSPVANTGQFFCKSHNKTPARYHCPTCRKYFCDLCVMTRPGTAGKICRTCAVMLTQLQMQNFRAAPVKGFYSRLPGAFGYPFKGFGTAILLLAAFVFGGVDYLDNIGWFNTPLGWAIQVAVYGLLFLFMQNVIYTTTSDESEPLGFPDGSEMFGAAFQLSGTILVSFALPIGLLIARFMDVDVPMAAIITTAVLGCLYFPMAFLAVAMKDTVWAANPLIVIPTILRLPLDYFATTILTIGIFGVRLLGTQFSDAAAGTTLSTKDMSTLFISLAVQAVWAFFSIYLLTVNMRILGLLYNARRSQFGWFSR